MVLAATVLLIPPSVAQCIGGGAGTLDCPLTISGPERVDEGTPIELDASPANYDSYHWEVTSGEISSGQGTPSIVIVNVAGGASVTATVSVSAADGCRNSKSHTTAVWAQRLTAQVVESAVQDKEKTRSYVRFIDSKFDPSSEVYAHSELLYTKAQTAYDRWVQSATNAIEEGSIESQTTSSKLQQLATDANKLALDFINYVDSQPVRPQSKAITFASPVSIGRKIANDFKVVRESHFAQSRMIGLTDASAKASWIDLQKKLSDSFLQAAKWETWGEILSPSEKPGEEVKPLVPAAKAENEETTSDGQRYALLVGVEEYSEIPRLSGPNKDVCVLRQILTSVGGFKSQNIIVLAKPGSCPNVQTLPPTPEQVVNAIDKLNSVMRKNSFFLFSFSGHGVSRGDESYLMLQNSTETSGAPTKSVSIKGLINQLVAGVAAPEHMLFLVDACRTSVSAGSTDPGLDRGFAESFEQMAKYGKTHSASVVFSAKLGEQSYIRSTGPVSFFTWAVIKGLIGEAAERDGRVTMRGLAEYVEKEVPELIRVDFLSDNKVQQHPTTRNFGVGQEDFVVSKVPAPSTMFFYSVEAFLVPLSKAGKILATPLHVDLVSPRPLGFLDETLPLNIKVVGPLNIIGIPYGKIDKQKVGSWDYLVRMTFHHGRWHRAFVMCPASPNVPENEKFERAQEIKTYISDGVLVIDPLISFMMWGEALRDPDGRMGEERASGNHIEYTTYSMKCLER